MNRRLEEIEELLTHTGLTDVEVSEVHFLIALARSLEAEVKALREACEFYAIPETYFGIGIFPDRPCGEFIDDIGDCEGEEMGMTRKPGNKAREALAKADAIAAKREEGLG
jgi:hypothetical protein